MAKVYFLQLVALMDSIILGIRTITALDLVHQVIYYIIYHSGDSIFQDHYPCQSSGLKIY